MTKVQDLLDSKKGGNVWFVAPEQSVFEAVQMMAEKGIGALAVMREEELIGIISERDCARKTILDDCNAADTPVKDIMTRQVFHTMPEQNVEECMVVMTKNHIRHLPVMQDGKMIGMISLGDVVENIIQEQKDKIEHLEHYLVWEESY